ncbi:MAG: hypothetical protein DRI94_08460 [Bacteroidetes bacterium]|nr:MAG: hypothetical protein DRI94_08460 [Bacteroidota bacterium]
MEEKVNKKIKVCFFSPASYPFFFPNSKVAHGGAELQMYLLAKALSEEAEFKISFLIGNYGQNKVIIQDKISLVKTIRLEKKENGFSKFFKAVKLFFQLIKLKSDVIIATNANALVGIITFYSKLSGNKFIYRSSSLIDVNGEYIKNNGLSGKIYKYGLEKAGQVITQNQNHKKLLKENYNIDAKVIKNIFPVKEYKYTKKEFILWISRYHKIKNPELFLQIAENSPNKQFVMICPFTKSEKENWEKLYQKANKIPNLKFIEKVPFAEIQEYFNKALLFVNTSDFEGFPNTFLQAAQGKTPIVSLNVNPDNFITEYNCGIFAEGKFEKLLSDTEKLLQNETGLKIKGENLFNYLKENHDIKIIEKQLKEAIKSIL